MLKLERRKNKKVIGVNKTGIVINWTPLSMDVFHNSAETR